MPIVGQLGCLGIPWLRVNFFLFFFLFVIGSEPKADHFQPKKGEKKKVG